MNLAAKKILLAVGTVLLAGAVGLAQTTGGATSSSKTKKKHSTPASTSSTQSDQNASSPSTAEASTPTSTTSSANPALPQSDSSASPASSSSATDSSAVKAGNSGFDDTSSQTAAGSSAPASAASQTAATQYASGSAAPAQSASPQSGAQTPSSDEISNGPVAETVSDSNALIGWATRNAASNTSVKYGTNRASLSETAQGTDGSDGKNHHAKLEGLSPNTRYYFQITANGQALGGVGTFRTTAAGEQPIQSKAVIPQK